MLEAIRLLKREYSQVRFTMIGGFVGPRDWLRGRDDVIDEVIVSAPRSVVRQKLTEAHAFFFPSLFEGGALALHEAASMGLPIVTTHNSGADFLKQSNSGFVLPIRDVSGYVDSFASLITDSDLLQAKTLNALQWSEHSSWKQYGEDLSSL